jgi:methionyl-tRNA formyltransferase
MCNVNKGLSVVFFGTPAFAAELFEWLLTKNINIVAVVTKPDRPKGRSDKLIPSEVKLKAQALAPHVPIWQPESAKSDDFFHALELLKADLFIVVAYGEIIQQRLLDLPTYGAINVHASLLPTYRGAAPIQRCIMEGQTQSGVTIMQMVRKMDAGAMLRVAKVAIGEDTTYGELECALCQASKEPLLQVVQEYASGIVPAHTPQDENLVTFAPKIELEECQIDWLRPAGDIHNLVRGVNPHPGAWCWVESKGEKKRLKIFRSRVRSDLEGVAGAVLPSSAGQFFVACGQGALDIIEVQLEGKRKMNAHEFLQGHQGLQRLQ